jgi:hypothetical protein
MDESLSLIGGRIVESRRMSEPSDRLREIRALDHQQMDPVFTGSIHACVPTPAMAEGSGRQRGGHSLRFADDAPTEAPGVAGSEAGDEVAALHGGHLFDGFLFQIAFPAGLAAVEDHLANFA